MTDTYPTLIPVKTRKLIPPQNDLYAALKESLPSLQNGDILVISSKVMSIHEGYCFSADEIDKDTLAQQEAEYWLPRETSPHRFMLSIKHGIIVGSAGVDESNGGGYIIPLPKNPLKSCQKLRHWIKQEYNLSHCGVIISDSHSIPLHQGALGISLAACGFNCLKYYKGTPDLFNKPLRVERANIPDTLAAAANGIMGEGNQQTPCVIIRNWPNITYTENNTWSDFVVEPENDAFYELLKPFLQHKVKT
ncbi:MAG: coenzyme F420-0:L-glutamate ligase [Alphaproteobacteria bacterium]|nr:coenzyme F420-0:L-glutamate ligase [Alphaproteobacteria bacterium]MDD9919352.1 coenzyme F420-0:L-glutamate ligase [Alphaproteobacteria bacterium]